MPGRGSFPGEEEMRAERNEAEIEGALGVARSHVRWRNGLSLLAATVAIPVFFAALWVASYRFTLADFPTWPVLLFPLVWLLVILIQAQRRHITRSLRALYLDRALDLDQRLTTLIELEGKAVSTGETEAQSYFRRRLEEEASEVIATKLPLLRGKYNSRISVARGAAALASVACLVLAIAVPTTFGPTWCRGPACLLT
jgi:hypothetical protein